LAEEFVPFFHNLFKEEKGIFGPPDAEALLSITDNLCQKMENRIAALQKDLSLAQQSRGAAEPDIDMVMSEEAYWLMWRFLQLTGLKNVDRDFVYDESGATLMALYEVLKRADNDHEKQAIARYIENVNEYRQYFDTRDVEIHVLVF